MKIGHDREISECVLQISLEKRGPRRGRRDWIEKVGLKLWVLFWKDDDNVRDRIT